MKNEFAEYQRRVQEVYKAYLEVRDKSHEILKEEKTGNRKSIDDLSKPFLEGHFTLAIIGKMSAGKSTFVNAFLGKQNLLATGFGQTTCTLTEIVHDNEERYEVAFADGSRKTYTSLSELQAHMAIPDKYRELPIKQLNDAIVEGKDLDTILDQAQLESWEHKYKAKIEQELVQSYMCDYNITNIPVKVYIYTQLPENYVGWRIIDTPGLEASGGVEEETNQLLEKGGIDAVIFVNSCKDQIESKTFQSIVERTISSLTEKVKKRLFIVRTHGADRDYQRNKEGELKNMERIFVQHLGVHEDRIFTVDSLTEMFMKTVAEEKLDLSNRSLPCPHSWEDLMWQAARSILRDAHDTLEDNGQEVVNETIWDQLDIWANFEALERQLNEFVKTEKEQAYNEFLALVNKDIAYYIQELNDRAVLLRRHTKSPQALARAAEEASRHQEELKKRVNAMLSILREDYSRTAIQKRFSAIEENIKAISGGLEEMKAQFRREANEMDNKKELIWKEVARRLSQELDQELKNFPELNLSPIDFNAMTGQAINDATYEEVVGYHQKTVKEEGMLGSLKRLFSLDTYGYKEVNDLSKPILETRLSEQSFKNSVVSQFLKMMDKIREALVKQIQEYGSSVQKEINKEIDATQKKYSQLQTEFVGADAAMNQAAAFDKCAKQIQDIAEKLR